MSVSTGLTMAVPGLAQIDTGGLIPITMIGVGGIIVLVWIVAATIDSIVKTRAREETSREIAAFVAEGSITPEDAKTLLSISHQGDIAKHAAEWGSNPDKVVQLIRAIKGEVVEPKVPPDSAGGSG